jgi:phage terminase small subunit
MSEVFLTSKQERFALNYVKSPDMNATEAAIQAGYSPKTAYAIAAENLRKPQILERITQLRKAAEDKTIASVVERKQVLTEIVRGRISQFVDGNRINATVSDINTAAIAEVTTAEIRVGRGEDAPVIDVTKLKLRDPIAAISELNKMEGVYDTRTIVNNDNRSVNIMVRSEEAKQLIEGINERFKDNS